MTREEAIKWLKDIHRRFNPTGENLENEGGDVHLQALNMAIEALQNLSKPNNGLQGSDLISRQDAIDALGEEPEIWNDTEEEWAYRNAWVEHISAIKSLPSADRPTGKWEIKTETDEYGLKRPKLVCSKCEKEPAAWDLTELFEFCPNCGSRNVREDGDTE